ncbi:hypothetical protein BGW39_007239 [Mortierella sp. 14UC]|nr:hypothetical protein BGW39_007239 [Mortierella sp. 14UC]
MTNHPLKLLDPEVPDDDTSSTAHSAKKSEISKPTSTHSGTKSVMMTKDAPLPPLPTELNSTTSAVPAAPHTDVRPSIIVKLPEKNERIENTPQLVYCLALLLKSQEIKLNEDKQAWLQTMEQDPVEQNHIRWLTTRMVEEFVKDPFKNSIEIAEIVLLGTVLEREHYRKLLSCFVKEFDDARLLDVDLLQGLVQLVQSSSSGFLEPNDLVKILGMLRTRLAGTHQQPTEHPYHLTLAISRVLDVMADHKVKDLDRVQEHEPLSGILSGLRNSSDPYLLYQVCYAYQALQYVPDNETALQAVLRHSTGVLDGLVKVSSVIKLDLASVLEGLGSLQESLGDTFKVARTAYEGFCSLLESGRGVFDSLKEGYGSGKKLPWYTAIRAAYTFAQADQLGDLKQLVYEAPCHGDPLFQWGVCQLLGEVASDTVVDTTHRTQAIDLLGDLYKNDPSWGQDESVKIWMETIIGQLAASSDDAASTLARALLNDLKLDQGATSKLPYPLRSRLPLPAASPVLARVQSITFVEYDLHKIRLQRLKETQLPIYIPPLAKASLQARDDDLFPLMDKVQEFLASDRQVMLVLGDSGAGKSTFNTHLESELLQGYKGGGVIPLSINLPAIDQPDQDMITKQLKIYNLKDDQILELKLHRRFVLICDGYDESQQLVNLYRTNMLNQPGQWSAKMVISCRSQYLGQDYRSRFMPQSGGHYSRPATELFQEAVITPFSRAQIENYIEQYVPLEPRTWTTHDYVDRLTAIPHLMELVKNPFLLSLALEALPAVTEGQQDLSAIKLARVQLYDIFVVHWLNVNKRRLESNALSDSDRTILDQLLDAGFVSMGVDYSRRLALAIFEKQDGNPVVKYTHLSDKNTWKVKFFGPDPEVRLLRESSPVGRTGSLFKFIHRSMLEYFFSRIVYEPSSQGDDDGFGPQVDSASSTTQSLDPNGPFFEFNLVGEPSIIQFLCDRVKQHSGFEKQLRAVVEQSKTDASAAIAATNAMSILVRAGIRFNGLDLRGIKIPGADLSDGQFDSAQMQKADLHGPY